MKTRIISIFTALLILLTVSGCTTTAQRRADEVSTVKRGIVVDLKEVTLAGQSSGAGAAIGAAAGTMIGGQGGSLKRVVIGAIIGQVAGAFAGNAAEKKLTETSGIEVGIKLDDGSEISVPQRREAAEWLRVGDRVRVIQTGSRATVEKA